MRAGSAVYRTRAAAAEATGRPTLYTSESVHGSNDDEAGRLVLLSDTSRNRCRMRVRLSISAGRWSHVIRSSRRTCVAHIIQFARRPDAECKRPVALLRTSPLCCGK